MRPSGWKRIPSDEEELSISLLCSMGPRLRENLEELGLRPKDASRLSEALIAPPMVARDHASAADFAAQVAALRVHVTV